MNRKPPPTYRAPLLEVIFWTVKICEAWIEFYEELPEEERVKQTALYMATRDLLFDAREHWENF